MNKDVPKKILYITTKSDLGGVAKYLLEIAQKLPSHIEPYFIMSSEGYLSYELEKIGILKEHIFFIPMTNDIFNLPLHLKSNWQILNLVLKIRPDLIHCNATTASIVGAVVGFLTRTTTIYTVHGWPFTDGISHKKQIFYKILEFFMCAVYKKIICVSEFDTQIGIKALPMYKNKMQTIHNGISDIDKIYIKKEFSSGELKLVMISRFCPQKDPYTLIDAVNKLSWDGFKISLDLWGYGEELEKVKEKIKNNKNIRYCGEIEDVTTVLKDYDVYALISNWEGLPIGIIEALRAGMPVLVSDVGGNKELVENNGYLVQRGDVEDCKKQIKKLYEENLSSLGENSRKLYEKEFNVDKMIKETMILYEEEIGKSWIR